MRPLRAGQLGHVKRVVKVHLAESGLGASLANGGAHGAAHPVDFEQRHMAVQAIEVHFTHLESLVPRTVTRTAQQLATRHGTSHERPHLAHGRIGHQLTQQLPADQTRGSSQQNPPRCRS